MAEPGERRPVRRLWRRSALPRSRPALALGALVAVSIVVLLLVGLTRARPGRDVPDFDPAATTTTVEPPPPLPRSMTTIGTLAAPPKAATTTTRRR